MRPAARRGAQGVLRVDNVEICGEEKADSFSDSKSNQRSLMVGPSKREIGFGLGGLPSLNRVSSQVSTGSDIDALHSLPVESCELTLHVVSKSLATRDRGGGGQRDSD